MPFKDKQKQKEYNEKYQKKYYIKNREKRLEQNRQNYIDNREKIRKRHKQNHIDDRDNRNKYQINKYKTDSKYNLSRRMKLAVWRTLHNNKGNKSWRSFIDYSLDDLIKRLEQTMPRGYTWQNYLEGRLHIDHKIPISAFNYTKPEHPDFKRCWALDNLRLLPAKENLIKGNKLTKPFQPTLQLG